MPNFDTEFPKQVMIGVHEGYCNMRCPQCPVNSPLRGLTPPKGTMAYEDFVKILDECAPYKPRIIPHSEYEPLLIPDYARYFRAIKERGMAITLNTNGMLITEKVAQELTDIGVDSITVSVDAFTPETLMKVRGTDKLDKLRQAVHNLLNARGKAMIPRVSVSFTRQEANEHEEKDFLDYWLKHVDFVRSGVFFENRKLREKFSLARRPCRYPFDQMTINFRGEMRICQADYMSEAPVGDVLKDGVKAVWLGETMREFRRMHLEERYQDHKLCASCDYWTFFATEDTETEDLLIRKSPFATIYNRKDRLGNWNQNVLNRVNYDDIKK